jgi:hypothetical protein
MAKQIAKLLKASIEDTSDLKKIAQRLAQKGRGGDSMLVHITPKEAGMLKEAGGAGSINPDTGLMEFYDGDGGFDLMKYAGSPDITTGGYTSGKGLGYSPSDFDTPIKSSLPDMSAYSLVPQGYEPNVRTGGYVSPEAVEPTSRFGIYGARPGGVGFRAPVAGTGEGISLQQARAAAPSAPYTPGAYTPIPEVQQALKREPTILERLKQPQTLEQLGLAGLQAIPGILASRQAAAQGRQAKAELQTMAEPYKRRGETMITQAERGELTPVEQQQLQALQARAAQGAAARGGVGAEQAQAQIEAFRQQLLANKYDMGIKVANIGDQIAAGAIRTGMSADQYVNELTNTYFTNIARSLYGQPPQVAQAQQMTPRG